MQATIERTNSLIIYKDTNQVIQPHTFQSFFFPNGEPVGIRVPDYQRAYAWEQKQVGLFIGDLIKYQGNGNRYYFGHFIAENIDTTWEIVDGQQRITTVVLFLMVCQIYSPLIDDSTAYLLTKSFQTVSYDREALVIMGKKLKDFLIASGQFIEKKSPTDEQIRETFSLSEKSFTRSQRKMALALLSFHQAFQIGGLKQDNIPDYIAVVMNAHCSCHLTQDRSVAINIFEMHNTRGVPLTTLEIIKAVLMKFVYDKAHSERESYIGQIQMEFGEIYGMEERVAAGSFRWEMTLEQLLRLHLRVVDDGTKNRKEDFHSPATNANADLLVAYVDSRLYFKDADKTKPKTADEGVLYALNLAKEFKKSVRIASEVLPRWDISDSLVGDVLILEREWSCQFFLLVCRRLETEDGKADGKIGEQTLLLWEKLLFIRDFHEKYHNLSYRDNFPELFESCKSDEAEITKVVNFYLENGFRSDRTKGLQFIVSDYLKQNEPNILGNAFYWWKHKMIYAIYKFEVYRGAEIRKVMKSNISVEHILPQNWHWIRTEDEHLKTMTDNEWESFQKKIDICINGIGNLLLITSAENTSLSNQHPAKKSYIGYEDGGSYKEHMINQERWRASKEWAKLIQDRGTIIIDFIQSSLVGIPAQKFAAPAPPDCPSPL